MVGHRLVFIMLRFIIVGPVLEKDCSIKNLTALLAMQPLLDESDLSSLSFSEFIRATYSLYKHNNQDIDSLSLDGQDMDNNELDLIVALTLDNCSTNKSTSGDNWINQ